MYRTVIGIAVALAIGLGVVGLTFSANRDKPADFVFINGSEPKSLDPHIMTGQVEGRIADAIFEGLTYRDPKSLIPTPGMAKSWSVSPDGKTYTFTMREGVTWNDGTPITSEDFAYSWRRLQEPELASEYAYIMHMIKWTAEFNTFQGNVYALIGMPPASGSDDDKAEAQTQRERLTAIVRAFQENEDFAKARQSLAEWTDLRKAEKGDKPMRGAVRALEVLIEGRTQSMGVEEWNKFMAAQKLNEALKATKDPTLQSVLSSREETLTMERLGEVRDALIRAALYRWGEWLTADEKLGTSGGVFAPDSNTLVVELRSQTPYFLDIVSFYTAHPVPRHIVEKYPDNWFLPDRIVSNGPFAMTTWRVNERIRLEKSDAYWNPSTIRVDIIDALPVENTTTALNLFLTGDVDWAPGPPPDLIDIIKEQPEYRAAAGFVTYYYRFNCTRAPFTDPRVRKAVCMAINRQSLVDGVLRAGQEPAFLYVPPGLPGYDAPQSHIQEDAAAAKKLFNEAIATMKAPDGSLVYPGGKLKRPLSILFNTSEIHSKLADAIADQLRKSLGIEVEAVNQEWQAYQASTLELKYDMARAGWIGDYMDPNTFLDMWETNGGNNQTGWSSPLYDQLLRFSKDAEQFLPVADKWIPSIP